MIDPTPGPSPTSDRASSHVPADAGGSTTGEEPWTPDGRYPVADDPASGGGPAVGTAVAWLVILALVGFLAFGRGGGGGGMPVNPDGTVRIPSDDPVAAALLTIQGRYGIGLARFQDMVASSSTPGAGISRGGSGKGTSGGSATPAAPTSPGSPNAPGSGGARTSGDTAAGGFAGAQVFEQVATMIPTGPPRVRLRMAILGAELIGPERGIQELDELDEAVAALDEARAGGFALDEADRQLATDLRRHLESLAAGGGGQLEDAAAQRLEAALGWWGSVAAVLEAEAPRREEVLGAAIRTTLTVLGAFILAIVGGLVGLAILITGVVFAVSGRLSLVAPVTEVGRRRHGVLAEVFALWLVVFFALQLIGGAVANAANAGSGGGLVAACLAFALSLLALLWGPIRGMGAAEYATVAGLGFGRGILRETAAGVIGYLATLPLLAVGLALTLIAMEVTSGLQGTPGTSDPVEALLPAGGPAHPIIGEVGRSGFVTLMVLLAGAVAAPLVEEIFFRGCLHSHLRHVLGVAGRGVAAGGAAVLTALIFAAIHPQGWLAVPALMGLAIGFSFVREWRRSVVAPIVMHAISNGIVLGLMVLLLA